MFKDSASSILFLIVIFVVLLDSFLVAERWEEKGQLSTALEPLILEDILEQKSSSIVSEITEEQTLTSPPFTTQAPQRIWEEPWSDYAEEAVVYMAFKWARQEALANRDEIALDLLAIGAWEEEQFGSSKDTDALQTLRILQEFYGLNAELSYEVSAETILSALDQGKILILPVNGQILANPYYGKPGPEHHMILVYSFDGLNLLTNDPGTIRGEGYAYEIQKILESIQDLNGEKRMIIISL